MKRKEFLGSSAGILLGAGMQTMIPSPLRALGRARTPSDQINIAAIGINGQGWSDLMASLKEPNVHCVALCDVDQHVLTRREADLVKAGFPKADTYSDYRKVLDRRDVDAVIIGTPDHWHCLIMTDAAKAGKDIYVEKPVGNSIVECKTMVDAQVKYNRVVQVGQWQRSQQHFADAVAFVQSGKLGKVRLVKAWAYIGWKHAVPVQPDSAPPVGVDYTTWLGPAQNRPFNLNRFHFNFRWYWDYAGGLMTDWGVHLLDYALLGMNAHTPKSIMASGGKLAYPDDAEETPDTLTTIYEYEGFNIQWEHTIGINNGNYNKDHGIAYIGENGMLILNREGWEVIPEKGKMEAVTWQPKVDDGLILHARNFLQAVRSRNMGDLKAPIQVGANVATVAQMGNIAYRTGKKLYWDNASLRFTDEAANHLLAAPYHNGYSIPTI